jgi:hypothetical protein
VNSQCVEEILESGIMSDGIWRVGIQDRRMTD